MRYRSALVLLLYHMFIVGSIGIIVVRDGFEASILRPKSVMFETEANARPVVSKAKAIK